MATTHDTIEDAWAWPCPYCGTSNSIESAVCVGCRAQLRDPEEDDLFTTVATDNAQMVDPGAPQVREVLWSTEVPPEAVIAEEVTETQPEPEPSLGDPGPTSQGTGGAGAGPFSAESGSPRPSAPAASTFAAAPPAPSGTSPHQPAPGTGAPTPFGPGQSTRTDAPPRTAGTHQDEGPGPRAGEWPVPDGTAPGHQLHGRPTGGFQTSPDHGAPEAPMGAATGHAGPTEQVTPDENGLSVAVAQLGREDRERCAVPIGVCGALLGDQEVVLGVLAGQLMGHASVLMVTNVRVLMANARRWKPLLDQFIPAADLTVHLRHDRDIASLTIVQGQRLTTLDGITDVAGAVELTERVRSLAQRAGGG